MPRVSSSFTGRWLPKIGHTPGGVDLASWQAALTGSEPWDVPLNAEVTGLADGEAEGVLYGGCLSILVASLGTPYEIKTKDTILFLEDLAAKPYQIDRMLMQLKLGGLYSTIFVASSSERCSIACSRQPRTTTLEKLLRESSVISEFPSPSVCAPVT